MADETLRLAAEILDKWSGPLKEMTKAVRNVSEATKKYNVEGERGTVSHTNKLFLLRREWNALGSTVRSIASPALAELSLGFGGISASAAGVGIAIAAAIAAVKDFGKTSISIINVSNQTKMLKEQVLAWQIAGDGMGVSMGAINEGLKSFGSLMDQTNRRSVYAFSRWQQMPGLFEALGGNQFTQMKDRMAQTRHALDVIGTIPDADKRRRALSILGLPEDIAGFSKEQIDRFFKSANEAVASGADKIDWEKGFDAAVAFEKIGGQLDILKKRIQGGIVGVGETIVGKPGGLIEGAIFGQEGLEGAPAWMRSGWDRLKKGVTGQGTGYRSPTVEELKANAPGVPSSIGGIPTRPGGLMGGSFDFEKMQKNIEKGSETGSHKGILDGLKEWFFQKQSYQPTGGGEGGFVGGGRHRMYVPGGDGGGGGETPIPAAFHPGGGVGPTGEPQESGDGAGAGMQGSDYLKASRQRFAQELSDTPGLRDELAGAVSMEHESDPTAVTESLLNRMDYSKGSIREGLHSGFYGPINRGQLPGRVAQLRRDPARMSRINRGIDAALGGSNVLEGATDQGSAGDPNFLWPGGRKMRHGEVYNDWGGGPGGHAGAAAWRERQQRAVRGEGRSIGEQFGPPMPPGMGKGSSLIDNARGAGVLGNLNGSASIELSLAGFPSGLKSQMSAEGLFKDVKLNRGFANNPASEDG